MKKIILGTLVLLTVGMVFGFAQAKNGNYYDGYNQAAKDYSKGEDYNPSYCEENRSVKKNIYNCTQGYQDSWERSSEVAPRTPKENSNNQ